MKRRKELADFNINSNYNLTAGIPSYPGITDTKSSPVFPENEGYSKKRKFEKLDSDSSLETSDGSSASDNKISNEIFQAKEETATSQSEAPSMINSQRQAMIDAEAVLTQKAKESKDERAKSTSSLRDVDANADWKFRNHTSKKYNELPSNGNRKSKFLPLLGAGASNAGKQAENVGGEIDSVPRPTNASGICADDIERQYARTIAQNQNSKGKGLGA